MTSQRLAHLGRIGPAGDGIENDEQLHYLPLNVC
jgi:hypothetical protein